MNIPKYKSILVSAVFSTITLYFIGLWPFREFISNNNGDESGLFLLMFSLIFWGFGFLLCFVIYLILKKLFPKVILPIFIIVSLSINIIGALPLGLYFAVVLGRSLVTTIYVHKFMDPTIDTTNLIIIDDGSCNYSFTINNPSNTTVTDASVNVTIQFEDADRLYNTCWGGTDTKIILNPGLNKFDYTTLNVSKYNPRRVLSSLNEKPLVARINLYVNGVYFSKRIVLEEQYKNEFVSRSHIYFNGN